MVTALDALIVLLILGALSPFRLAAAEVDRESAARVLAAIESIRAEDARRHVDVLADDTFEGREAGTRGGRAAAGYLIDFFAEHGLEGAGEDGRFWQGFGSGYRNILGLLRGSDPQLSEEVILVGAHFDHVGYGSYSNSYGPVGYIHNGADDNASGVAGMLEMIEALHHGQLEPRRSILFVLWDGEEKGLLGSKHWAAQPTLPLSRVKLAINADMIGRMRDETVEVYGPHTADGLRRFVSQANRETNLRLKFTWELKENSDHWTFFSRSIPILMFHTGLHDDYHRPSDDPEKVNNRGIQQVSRLLLRTTLTLARLDSLPDFRSASRSESPADLRRLERPFEPLPPRLGISWDTERIEDGLRVTRVRRLSPAEKAGILPGDRIVQFNGRSIESSEQFQVDILAAGSPITLRVDRDDADGPFDADVQLAGKPSRIGFSWRSSPADPQAMVIARVTPGSAARQAGVRYGDRLYRLNGQPIASSEWLLEQLTNEEGPFELELERQGRLRSVTIHPPPPIEREAVAATVRPEQLTSSAANSE